MNLYTGSSDVESKLQELWGTVLFFFVTNLQLQGASTLAVVTECLPKIWTSFSGECVKFYNGSFYHYLAMLSKYTFANFNIIAVIFMHL